MLEPKKIKFRKVHRGNRKGMAKGGTEVNFGSYGMKAMEPGWITARQIEATRISISRRVRKVGKMWIRIFPDKPITKKPLETRMGNLEYAMALGLVLISITIIIYSFVYLLNNRSVK